MVVKYRPADRGTTLSSIQRTCFEKDLTVSAISNIGTSSQAPRTPPPVDSDRYQDTVYSDHPSLHLQPIDSAKAPSNTDFSDSPHLQASANRFGPRSAPPMDQLGQRAPSQATDRSASHLQLISCDTKVLTSPIARTSKRPRIELVTGLHLQSINSATALPDHRLRISRTMLTYTEYYQSTPSPLGVGPARDLAYQTIYDYFAEETATPILLGRLLDLFEPEAVGALGIFLTDTFGRARLRLYQQGQGLWLPG
eukprot:jgi/Psemu1/56893/gm1.56893_g